MSAVSRYGGVRRTSAVVPGVKVSQANHDVSKNLLCIRIPGRTSIAHVCLDKGVVDIFD